MFLVNVLLAVAAIIWGVVAYRYLSPSINCILVILTGIVLGHAFYHQNVGPLPVTIDRVLWGLMLLHFLVLLKLNRAEIKPLNRTDLIVILLTVVLVFSTFLHDWQYKENLPLSRLLFFNLMPIGIYFVAKQCRLSTSQLVTLFAIFVGFGCYLGLTAIAEQRGINSLVFPRFILDPEQFEFLGRARGPFLNPVSCGIYLVTCTVATMFFWPRVPLAGKALVAGFTAMLFAATFLTLTRSVWIGAAIAVVIVVWNPAPPRLRGALVVVGTISALAVFGLFSDRLNSFKRDKHVTEAEMAQSISLRPILAHVAWKMFKDRPIAGHGFGQYSKVKKPYHYTETDHRPLRMALGYMQHNVFLSYLTETGLVGLGLLSGLLIALAVRSWRLWQARELPLPDRQLGLLGLVVLSNYCINGIFHDVSIIPHIGALLFFVLGLIENVSSRRLDGNSEMTMPDLHEPEARIAA